MNENRRLAYLTSAFPYLTETFILREVNELERQGWQVEVFALKRSPNPGRHESAARWENRVILSPLVSRQVLGATLAYLLEQPATLLTLWLSALWWHRGSWNLLVRTPIVLLRAAAIARSVKTLGIRHLHAHYATHPALAALVAAKLSGIRYSVTVHAHDLFMRQSGLVERLAGAAFVAGISEYNRRFLTRLHPRLAALNLPVVRCGVDPALFPPRLVPPDSETYRIVCVASLQTYKGQHVLFDAIRRLPGDLPLECLLVGDGPERGALEQLAASLGIADRVRFAGALPEHEVAAIVRAAGVFIAPSVVASSRQMDGIPVALMEALASGVPVIASKLSGIPELVIHDRTGLLVPPGDAVALAEAIVRIQSQPALARSLAEAGREHVLREFNLEHNVRLLAGYFDSAIAGNAASTQALPANGVVQSEPVR